MTATTPFRIKDFNTIVQDMILTARTHTDRISDYNIGSVARTLLETPALELDALYQAMYFGLLDAIPIALYQGFAFTALPATAASGYVVFTLADPVQEDTLIPAGTELRSPGESITYTTQAAATIPSGDTTVTVRIAATLTGAAGNANPHTLAAYEVTLNAGLSVDNPTAIGGGREAETAAEQRVRFIRFLQSLARDTLASLDYSARQAQVLSLEGLVMEQVTRVNLDETPGHVNLYAWNGHGQTSAALCAAVNQLIEGYWDSAAQQWVAGYRPAGMRVDVLPMAEQPVTVSLELDAAVADRTATLQTAAVSAVQAAILAEPVNGQLRPIELLNSVLVLPGITGARLITPTQAIVVPPYYALIPGAITLTWNPES